MYIKNTYTHTHSLTQKESNKNRTRKLDICGLIKEHNHMKLICTMIPFCKKENRMEGHI